MKTASFGMRFFFEMKLASLALIILLVPAVARANDFSGGNVVGYMTSAIRKGDTTLPVPKNPGGEKKTVGEYLGSLLESDLVLAYDRYRNDVWIRICDDGEGVYALDDSSATRAEDYPLVEMAGDQVLKVRRTRDEITTVALVGEMDTDVPLNVPDISQSVPLGKIKLPQHTVREMQHTITNRLSLPFETVVPRKFEISMRDGARLIAQVDPNTHLIVHAETGKPVNINAGDITGFNLLDQVESSTDKSTQKKALANVTKDIVQGAEEYRWSQRFRESLTGVIWNKEHPVVSVLMWLLSLIVLGYLNDLTTWIRGRINKFLYPVCRYFLNCTRTLYAHLRAILKFEK